jgi:Na+-translocating ferredoxin:NAD+ oxidoreductase RnfD subunit
MELKKNHVKSQILNIIFITLRVKRPTSYLPSRSSVVQTDLVLLCVCMWHAPDWMILAGR